MEAPPPPHHPPPTPPQQTDPPHPGRRVGDRWVLTGTAPIGRGSFADVWAGRDTATGEAVAVKALDLARLSPKLRAGLSSEVATLRAAEGAHVVALRGVVSEPDRLFLVMEHCAGGDVAALLRAAPGGRLGEGRPLWWCAGEEEDGGAGSPSSPPPPSPETRAMVSSSAPVSEAGLLGGAGLWCVCVVEARRVSAARERG